MATATTTIDERDGVEGTATGPTRSSAEPDAADPAIGLPGPFEVVRWATALTGEVMRLPSTVARAREVIVVLPGHLEDLIAALDRFSSLLDESLGEVRDEVRDVGGRLEKLQASIDALAAELGSTTNGIDLAMPVLSDAVVRLDERLQRMDELLGEVGGTVMGTFDAVPGLRRIARRQREALAAQNGSGRA